MNETILKKEWIEARKPFVNADGLIIDGQGWMTSPARKALDAKLLVIRTRINDLKGSVSKIQATKRKEIYEKAIFAKGKADLRGTFMAKMAADKLGAEVIELEPPDEDTGPELY